MPRLFTGLEIPKDIADSLSLLRGGLPGARWVAPENYHVTLRFIGDVDDAVAHEVESLLGRIHRGPFELRIGGLTSFGGKKPRAVVATVAASQSLIIHPACHAGAAARHIEPQRRRVSLLARPLSDAPVSDLAFRAVFVARLGRRRPICG